MPKIYIEVMGGVVCGVYSNAATEVVLIDHDNDPNTLEDIKLKEFEQDKISPGFAELAIN